MLFEETWKRLGWQPAASAAALTAAVKTPEADTAAKSAAPRRTVQAASRQVLDFEAFEEWQKNENRRKVLDLTVEPEEW